MQSNLLVHIRIFLSRGKGQSADGHLMRARTRIHAHTHTHSPSKRGKAALAFPMQTMRVLFTCLCDSNPVRTVNKGIKAQGQLASWWHTRDRASGVAHTRPSV